jgi:nitrogen regulatory protein PII
MNSSWEVVMKEVRAYIKPHKLAEVAYELRQLDELPGMNYTEVHGFGRHRAKKAAHKIVHGMVHFAPYIQIEIICRDEAVDKIVHVIQRYAHEGLRGDGKIVVSDIEKAIRISTGETGEDAL